MNAARSFGRILWKEYRQQRAYFLVLLGGAAILQLLVLLPSSWRVVPPPTIFGPIVDHQRNLIWWVTWVTYGSACCFLAGSASMAYAGERESRSEELLRRIPARWFELFAAKFLVAVLGFLLMLAALLPLGLEVAKLSDISITQLRHEVFDTTRAYAFWFAAAFPLPLLSFILLFSLILNRVLIALVCGTVIPLALFAIAVPLISARADLLWLQLGLPAAVLVFDAAIARHWLVASDPSQRPRWLPHLVFPRSEIARRKTAASTVALRSPVAWRRAFSSHCWKELRQMRVVPILFLAALVAQACAIRFVGAPPLTLSLLPWLMGTMAFNGDRGANAYRIYATQGVSPDGFWLVKQTIWLVATLLMVVLSYVSLSATLSWTQFRPLLGQVPLLYQLWIAIAFYSIAQLASLLVPSAIAAAAVGLLSIVFAFIVVESVPNESPRTAVVLVWTAVFFFFVASWLRVADWLADRNTLHAWAKVIAVVAIPHVAIIAVALLPLWTDVGSVFAVKDTPLRVLPPESRFAGHQRFRFHPRRTGPF